MLPTASDRRAQAQECEGVYRRDGSERVGAECGEEGRWGDSWTDGSGGAEEVGPEEGDEDSQVFWLDEG